MTTTAVHVPAPYDVRTVLDTLLGRAVAVRTGPPWAPLNGEPGTFALAVDERYAVRALAVCDMRFSAYAAAAIGLVPRTVAETAVSQRALGRRLQENLHEVLTVCAALHNATGAPHLRLHQVLHVGSEVSPQVQALGAVLGRRLDLSVTIPGYGTGRLSFVGIG